MLKNESPQRRGIRPRTPIFLRWLGAPPPDPRVVTSTYYYSFVEFIASAKMRFITFKKEQYNYSKCSVLLLPHFFTYFSLQTLYVC